MRKIVISLLLLSAGLSPVAIGAQAAQPQPAPSTNLLDITLEKRVAGGPPQPMPAAHVFKTGDIVRFKLHSSYNGYLYVTDQSTSGKFETLFPAAATGSDNRIAAGNQYLVPATEDGWFQIQEPAGFEVLYFLLSPTSLAQPPTAGGISHFVAPGPPSSLRPRCNDAVFRARGECMDDSAGASVLPPSAPLPPELAPLAGSASRDLTFTRKNDSTTVAATSTGAPVIYTFRLAHN